jgi:hypothetical protein
MMLKPVQIMMPELIPEEEEGLREEWEKRAGRHHLDAPPTQSEIEPAPSGCGPRFSPAARRATISGRHTSGLTKPKDRTRGRGESRGELGGLNLLAFT